MPSLRRHEFSVSWLFIGIALTSGIGALIHQTTPTTIPITTLFFLLVFSASFAFSFCFTHSLTTSGLVGIGVLFILVLRAYNLRAFYYPLFIIVFILLVEKYLINRP